MNCRKQLLIAAAIALGGVAPAAADIIDPTGDTFNALGVSHDITSASAVINGTNLSVSVNFAGPISAPSLFAANSVNGYIDFDTDQNPATPSSLVAAINAFMPPVPGPAINMDADFFVDLFSEAFNPGTVDIVDALFSVVGSVPIIFTANGFSFDVPLALLGGDDGLLNYSILVGNYGPAGGGAPEFTDRAPNGADPGVSAALPEPTSLLAFAMVIAAAGASSALRRRRR